MFRIVRAFIVGAYEFRRSFTTAYSMDNVAIAYDWGREWAHRLTLRRYDQ